MKNYARRCCQAMLLLMACPVGSFFGTATAAPVVIHPLGDSITWGYTTASAADSPGGYRQPLYANLKLAGLAVTFVGANTGNPSPLLTQDNQTHHDGYPKYTITEDNNNLDANVQPSGKPGNNGGFWLTGTGGRAAIYPDEILLLIGSNDNDGGTPAPVIEQRLESMLTKIYNLRPTTHVFVATIPPLPVPTDAGKTAIAKSYNTLIKTLTVPKFLVLGHKITAVDQYTNFIVASSPDGDTVNTGLFGDNIHPNEAGYELMGNTWSSAILNDPTNPPTAPGGFAATPVSANQINLTWSDNSTNEGAFLIERSLDGTTYNLVGYTGADVTNWVDTGLAASTAYHYRVRAKNTAGESTNTTPTSATTLSPSLLSAPTSLIASPGYAKAGLKWDAVAGAVNYNVKRSTTNGGPYTTISSPASTNFTDSSLVNGTKYFYVVSAVDAFGEGPNSVQATAIPSGMPVAHFRFDSNTLDSSGNNNHAVPTGTFSYDAGKQGSASALFNGSTFGTLAKVFQTNFTVVAWIKTTGTGNLPVVDAESPGTSADWGTFISAGKFGMFVGAPDTFIYSTTSVNDGNWHHVVATRRSDSGEARLYVDGILEKVATLPAGPRTASIDFHIGANHAPVSLAFFTGNMDDLRLYDDVLPAADIVALVNPPSPNLSSIQLGSNSGLLGTNSTLVLTGSGGNGNAQFVVLNTTNLITPQWTPIATNDFDGNGNFSVTNTFDIANPSGFFRLQLY